MHVYKYTMSNICNRCGSVISWNQKKREELGIRGPLNPDLTVHTCSMNNNGSAATAVVTNGGNGNGRNNHDTGKPETRPTAFIASSQQIKEQQLEQSPVVAAAASAIYPYSVKAEMNTKGLVMITCHTYNSDMDRAREDLVKLFTETVADLKVKGVKVLEA